MRFAERCHTFDAKPRLYVSIRLLEPGPGDEAVKRILQYLEGRFMDDINIVYVGFRDACPEHFPNHYHLSKVRAIFAQSFGTKKTKPSGYELETLFRHFYWKEASHVPYGNIFDRLPHSALLH